VRYLLLHHPDEHDKGEVARLLHLLHRVGDVTADCLRGRYGCSGGAGSGHHLSDEQAHCCKEGGCHGVNG